MPCTSRKLLKKIYKVTTEWDGKHYIGITLDWDYKLRQVHLCSLVNAGIHPEGSQTSPPRRPKETNTTLPKCRDKLWSEKAICDATIGRTAY